MVDDEIRAAGWFAEENRAILMQLISQYQVRSVVEIGSFLGLSAIWFAKRVDRVTCIDIWQETATIPNENNLVGTLARWDLPRNFFPIFRDNIMQSGVWHKILPVHGRSYEIHEHIPEVDLVYIDGDHSYEGCKRDIELYRDKARAVICGDDYMVREGFGVIEAVREMFPDHCVHGAFWWVVK